MRKTNTETLENCIYEAALKAGVNLTHSCRAALNDACERESGSASKFALETIIENAETAKREVMPVCQDTGLAVVILEIGQEVYLEGKPLSEALELTNKAVAEALDGLPAHKMHCSVLAEEAIRAAIKDYYDKNGIEYDKAKFPDPHDEE